MLSKEGFEMWTKFLVVFLLAWLGGVTVVAMLGVGH